MSENSSEVALAASTETYVEKFLATDEQLTRVANALEKMVPGYEKYSADYFNSMFIPQRTRKIYGTKVWKFASNPTSTCEKTRDNVGLVCQPSTDAVEGTDDYKNIPLFKWYECNYKRYDDGFAYPVAMIGDGNYQETGAVDCGALQMTFYYKQIETENYTEWLISDSPNHALGLKPWFAAVRADGTVMPYFIYSRFHSVTASDGKLRSQPGKVAINQSHDNIIVNYQKKGAGYWGAGIDRETFGIIMLMIKYATKNSQTIFQGNTNYSMQTKSSVERSTKATYFPIPKSEKTSWQIGSSVIVGYGRDKGDGSVDLDRGNSTMYKYAYAAKILRIDDLDADNCAVYLDCEPFDTTPVTGGSATQYIYMSSWHWDSGCTDVVIGHRDGSPTSNTDGKHPYRIQGLEFSVGGWTIPGDTVMVFNADYSKDVYRAPRGVAHSSSEATIKNTYTKIGTIPAKADGSDSWIGDISIVDGVWFPSAFGPGGGQGVGDMLYAGGRSTSGMREYIMDGSLGLGSGAGLCFLHCGNGLGNAWWNFLSLD